MLAVISPGNAKADVGWGRNWNTYLLASGVRNVSAKNY